MQEGSFIGMAGQKLVVSASQGLPNPAQLPPAEAPPPWRLVATLLSDVGPDLLRRVPGLPFGSSYVEAGKGGLQPNLVRDGELAGRPL